MIYLLGGPPRVGKSKIAGRFTATYGISSVSTDSLGAVLQSVLDPKAAPGLFAVGALPLAEKVEMMAARPRRRIDLQVEESRATWRAVEPFIRRESEEGRDLLVEGVAVLPALVVRLEGIDHRAVFVGCRGGDHEANLRKGAAQDESDWMRDATDEYIQAFAAFVERMSGFLAEQAGEHGLPFVEMSGMPFEHAVNAVARLLLGETSEA
jgi:2-phosphoglycerate kinase